MPHVPEIPDCLRGIPMVARMRTSLLSPLRQHAVSESKRGRIVRGPEAQDIHGLP